jgi:hypothetical protein
MQDKYVGDIGDFGKYALLKSLAQGDVVLGIVWYRTAAKGGTGDGTLTQYLSSLDAAKGLGRCDEKLFTCVRGIVESKDRRVARVRELGIFLTPTVFYEDLLDFDGLPLGSRREARRRWCQNALDRVSKADLVFLDPDSGLSLNEAIKYRKAGSKYVFLDELQAFLEKQKSTILYCHQGRRKGGLEEQIREGIGLLSSKNRIGKAWAFSFRRQSQIEAQLRNLVPVGILFL